MTKDELSLLWRGYGYDAMYETWTCGHCSSVVKDPELHTNWHNDIREALIGIVDLT